MAKECIEYKLVKNEAGHVTSPSWMEDGGYYMDSSTKTLIGFVPVISERDYYVPDSVAILAEQEFVNRGMTMHGASPFTKDPVEEGGDPVAMTNQEAEASLRAFYQAKVA